ncbi:MAG TPA: hypothetical protein VLA88_06360 [Candidatus Saccharimonadales bacterium]|nr:hypothetical protein [Candidatus Saccharimonadales bacterium]
MTRVKIAVAIIVGLGVLFGGLVSVVPLPGSAGGFQEIAPLMVLLVTTTIGAAILFFLGLNGFKKDFRRTYYLICAGLLSQAIGSVVYLTWNYFGVYADILMTITGEFPVVAGIVLIYIGLVRFATLLGVHGWPLKLWYVAAAFVSSAALIGAFIHVPAGNLDPVFAFTQLLVYSEMFFYALSAYLLHRLRSVANTTYKHSLLWFMIAMIVSIFGAGGLLSTAYITYSDSIESAMIGIPYVISNIMLLISGYQFNKIATTTDIPTGVKSDQLLDSITLLSSLVSNTRTIEQTLDILRRVTAAHQGNTQWNASEREKLLTVYYAIETYLVFKEPLRSFSQDQIRKMIEQRFNWSPSQFA